MTRNSKGVVSALGAVILWSTSYSLIKVGLNTMPPYSIALTRGIITMFILLIAVHLQGQTKNLLTIIKKDGLLVLVLGATGFTFLQIFQNIGLTKTSSSLTSVLINTDPIFIFLMAILFLKEKVNVFKTVGILTGLVGITIIVFNGEGIRETITSNLFWGNILVLLASMSWSVYSVIIKGSIKKYSPIILTTVTYITGTILMLPFSIALEPIKILKPLSAVYIFIILYLGMVSGVGGFLWNYSLSQIEATRTAIFLYLIPIIGISIGVLILKEQFTLFHLIGTVVVLLSIYLTEKTIYRGKSKLR